MNFHTVPPLSPSRVFSVANSIFSRTLRMGCFSMFRWIGIAAVGLIAPGCVYLPYCVPAFQQIGALETDPEWDDVRVFRVEGRARIVNQTFMMQIPYAEYEAVTLGEIDPSVLDDQTIVGIERGIFCLGMINMVSSASYRQLAVHLYRPGYRTIQLMADGSIWPWTRPGSLNWIPVTNAAESEQAVESLLAMNHPPYLAEFRQPREMELSPGGALPAHRKSLLFAATEYERIAGLVDDAEPEADTTRERLRQKASRLRELADRD